jgi:aldehyde:ferredoxin oxidoreductase
MSTLNLKEVSGFDYQRPSIEKGYTNHSLHIDIGDGQMDMKPISQEVKQKFTGGKGYDLYLLWQAVNPDTKWDSSENAVCIGAGPLAGTPVYPGSGKSIVTTISPLTGIPIDSNVGGYFGPYLKFSGFDAMCVTGKSDKELVIFIDGVEGKVQILEAEGLPDTAGRITETLTHHFGQGSPRGISVVTAGPGAKHSLIGCLNFSWFDSGRGITRLKQAGRGGIGSVFMDKGIRAIVARWDKVKLATNAPADPEALKKVGRAHGGEIRELDPKQNEMAVLGTTHLTEIMDAHDCLPVKNFRYGMHKQTGNLGHEVYRRLFHPGFDGCWMGCTVACAHGVKDFIPMTGPFKGKKVFVDGPEYETVAGCGSNLGIFDPFAVLEINFYCDIYGLDTISVGTGLAFVMECYEEGLITSEHTGGLEICFGAREAALEVIHQLARGEGFGLIFGQGIRRMKAHFAEHFGSDPKHMQDIGMESKGLEFSEYMTKESLAQQGGYGLALKGPQHDEAWLIFLDMVHNFMPSFEQKAESLHWFPMFRTWFSLCGLCKLPWNDITPEDNKDTKEPAKVMKHVTWYTEYFNAVTGNQMEPDDLIAMSERVYNFQRVFNRRMGQGTREHDSLPFRAMGPVTVEEYESRAERYDGQLKEKQGIDPSGMSTKDKLAALRKFREEQYELLKDAVYKRRGWDNNGVPTLAKMKELGMDLPEVVEVLERKG